MPCVLLLSRVTHMCDSGSKFIYICPRFAVVLLWVFIDDAIASCSNFAVWLIIDNYHILYAKEVENLCDLHLKITKYLN